jgi:LacI family transcriptional regulator
MATEGVKNLKELAELLNLSVSTVSRVINGKAAAFRISEATSKRVLNAAREMNYSANLIARGLKLEKTETLGLIIPDVANSFFASIAKTIEIEARKAGYTIILCDSLDDEGTEKELLQLILGRKADGLIIAPVGRNFEHIELVRESGTPVIIIDRYFPGSSLPYIATDNYIGARKAVEYILSQGHTRIACIQGVRGTSPNTDRVKGYTDVLLTAGIHPQEDYMPGDSFGEQNGYEQTLSLMKLPQPPTAIFALSNLISLGILRALKQLSLTVPEDVSVLSFDEQPYSAFLASPMTTIEQRRNDIAIAAVKQLIEMITSGSRNLQLQQLLEPRLIIRDSVKMIKLKTHNSKLITQ